MSQLSQQLFLQRIFGRRHFFSRLPRLQHLRGLQQLVGAQQSAGAGAQQAATGAAQVGAAPQPLPQGAAQVGAAPQPLPAPQGAAQLGPAPHASAQGAAQLGAESQQVCRWSRNRPALATLEPATSTRAAVRVVHFILRSPNVPGGVCGGKLTGWPSLAFLGLIPTRYDSVWVHLPILSAHLQANLRAGGATFGKSEFPAFNEAIREDLTVIPPATRRVWQNLPLALWTPTSVSDPQDLFSTRLTINKEHSLCKVYAVGNSVANRLFTPRFFPVLQSKSSNAPERPHSQVPLRETKWPLV